MPVNVELSLEVWTRYQYLRDTGGHNQFVEKADKCEAFFRGDQWQQGDLDRLQAQRRPALTINKILSTISNVMGEQIYNRTDIAFQPRSGSPAATAEALTMVFRQISDNNQLDWKRSDMFCDGIITSRGFLDVRLDFTDSMMGEVRIETLNPKNVLIDSDADSYDPDDWNDIIITKWCNWQDIAMLYSEEDALLLKERNQSWFQYGFDSIDRTRDRFGPAIQEGYYQQYPEHNKIRRNIRVLERQYRRIAKQNHFVDPQTGDMRPVPDSWDRNRIAMVSQQFGLHVVPKMVKRIRWCVTADNLVLHDDWSPYKHFTVVPYFPFFRKGKTIGLVENLLGPQELLNKVTSQELHVVNTTANSGWKVKVGSLVNMTKQELEQRGAETGLVLELADVKDAEKIQPNQIPSGLDRVSYKAEEHIKTISGVTDYMAGTAREDVSAKAVQQNVQRGSVSQAKPLDSLARSDFILARNVVDTVQMYYTEPRLVNITKNRMTGEQDQIGVNQPTPEGAIANDLTVGEFQIVVTSVPHRQSLEESQFEQAKMLRAECGVQIPDDVLIEHSALYRKDDVIKKMAAAAQTPEAQHQAEIQRLGAELQLANLKAESARVEADAVLKQAKAQKESNAAAIELKNAQGQNPEVQKAELEMQIKQQEFELDRERAQMEIEFKRQELELKKQELQLKLQVTQETAEAKVEATRLQGAVKADQAQKQMELQGVQHQQGMEMQEEKHEQGMEQAKQNHKLTLQTQKVKAKQASKEKPNG